MSYKAYTEILDNDFFETSKGDCLAPPCASALDLKDYRLRLIDREKGWRYSINLTIFIMAYPLPKIYKLISLIVDEGDKENGIRPYNIFMNVLIIFLKPNIMRLRALLRSSSA